jgi:hypothetical protein
MQPTTIQEIIYSDNTVVDSTRTTDAGSATSYWFSRNLPATGKSMLDSTVGGYNCEVCKYYFAGHGAGNEVTNFKYYIGNRNSIAQDMTHMFYVEDAWVNPSSWTDSAIYNETGDWGEAPVAAPGSPNVSTSSDYLSTDDPTMSQYIYSGVTVEAAKATGSATWEVRLLYQYT